MWTVVAAERGVTIRRPRIARGFGPSQQLTLEEYERSWVQDRTRRTTKAWIAIACVSCPIAKPTMVVSPIMRSPEPFRFRCSARMRLVFCVAAMTLENTLPRAKCQPRPAMCTKSKRL